ncbi:hypothetical protein K437DRAFT_100785 [Tilletiaria anomala UBC 951]|uniref:Uncharacterized protein n=1 Tax=Tilletiaria anomala (strain ATCC 24038 / CBS 436.72 / UBC 951) TaxID=1037660 RepID=A0A066W7T7_TILAU|nr:uncharacterized protein K437DRAFT_100785 [Tilletiaria anomala UBC 951]KDN47149.1 hypothetical protein K437DRAFT_100785 [Tilletiaria anomala UBC 951]
MSPVSPPMFPRTPPSKSPSPRSPPPASPPSSVPQSGKLTGSRVKSLGAGSGSWAGAPPSQVVQLEDRGPLVHGDHRILCLADDLLVREAEDGNEVRSHRQRTPFACGKYRMAGEQIMGDTIFRTGTVAFTGCRRCMDACTITGKRPLPSVGGVLPSAGGATFRGRGALPSAVRALPSVEEALSSAGGAVGGPHSVAEGVSPAGRGAAIGARRTGAAGYGKDGRKRCTSAAIDKRSARSLLGSPHQCHCQHLVQLGVWGR